MQSLRTVDAELFTKTLAALCNKTQTWPSLVNDKATPYSNFCQAHVDVSLSSVTVHVAKFPRGSKGPEMDVVAVAERT